jgi:hypothetical protein
VGGVKNGRKRRRGKKKQEKKEDEMERIPKRQPTKAKILEG